MAVNVNPPPSIKIPREWQKSPEIVAYYKNFDRMMLQLWERTGGPTDSISDLKNKTADSFSSISQNLLKRIGSGVEFTVDTSGFTIDMSLITTDKAIA